MRLKKVVNFVLIEKCKIFLHRCECGLRPPPQETSPQEIVIPENVSKSHLEIVRWI